MVKVKYLRLDSGWLNTPLGYFVFSPGEERDVTEEQAKLLLGVSGFALVEEKKEAPKNIVKSKKVKVGGN
jgi:hypothetical protein